VKCNFIFAGDSSSSKESLHDNTENGFQELNLPGTSSTNLDLSGFDVLDIPSLLPRMYIIVRITVIIGLFK